VAAIELVIDGQTFMVEVGDVSRSPVTVKVNGVEKTVSFRDMAAAAPEEAAPKAEAAPVEAQAPAESPAAAQEPAPAPAGSVAGEVIAAPMPGKILSVGVAVGDSISEGDAVCTLEAMKMEMPINATASGTVKAIHVRVGQNVAFDDPLVTVG
jgi:biotin carboxyl carrier protein